MTQITNTSLKSTNIQWMGNIPEDWSIAPLKRYFSFEKWKDAQIFTAEYCGTHSWEYPVYSWQTEINWVMGMIDSYIYESEKRLFVTTVGAKAMTVKVLSWKYSLSQNCALIIERNDDVYVEFYYYLLQIQFAYEKWLLADVMQPSLRFEDLVKYKIPLPPLSTQTTIANFLDQKTEKISTLISNKKKLIDLLKEQKQSIIHRAVTKGIDKNVKMKDSGVPWIGQMSENWILMRSKFVTKIVPWYAYKAEEYMDSGGVPILRIGDIEENISIDWTKQVPQKYLETTPWMIVKKGDILIALTGATIWKSSLYSLNDVALLNQRVGIIRPTEKIDGKYLYFFVKSECFRKFVDFECYWWAQENISTSQIWDSSIPLPLLSEQERIVQYIEHETSKADTAIEKIEKEIILIEEYRTSLIYQAVTGKITIS